MSKMFKGMGKKMKKDCGVKLVKIERIKFKKVPIEVDDKKTFKKHYGSSCGGCDEHSYKVKPSYYESYGDYYGGYGYNYGSYGGGGGGGGGFDVSYGDGNFNFNYDG